LPQRALQSVHIRHPCPRTSHGIRNNSQEIGKTLSGGKKGRNLEESNTRGSLSRMDRSNRCPVQDRTELLLLNEVTVSASRTEGGSWFHKRGA